MNAVGELVFPGVALFVASLVLTAFSLWAGGRLTPWFLQESVEPPTVRSYFLDPMSDTDMSRPRVVTMLLACAIMLAVLLAMAISLRFAA